MNRSSNELEVLMESSGCMGNESSAAPGRNEHGISVVNRGH